MLEHWGFALPAVLERHRRGMFGAYVDAFAARLRDQGYVRFAEIPPGDSIGVRTSV